MKPSILYNFSALAPHLTFLSVDRSVGSVAELLGSTDSESTQRWSELQVLNCSHNYITSIDTSLVGLSALEVLDLSYNLVSKIENLQFCFRLVHLNLANNRIRSVENTVATLGNLRVLNLASNGLESAHGLEKLLGLERLDISDNQLMQPLDVARLAHLPNLAQLELRGNPLANIAKWRTQVFTLVLKDDLVIDGHGPSSSEKKAIETKRLETPIVPYAGHSTISKIGTIVTERPAFSSYGRALPSENLDPTMAYEYPELRPTDRKVIAEVAVTAPPLHIRPKISAAAPIASSPSTGSTFASSSPSVSSSPAAAALVATTVAQKKKQKHPKRRAVADIADPSASAEPQHDEEHEHHFAQATFADPASDPMLSFPMPPANRTGDGLSPIGDEKELGQILAWAAEDRWLLNYNAYRQRIDEQEARTEEEERARFAQSEAAKSGSTKNGARTSGEPAPGSLTDGIPSSASGADSAAAPGSSGGSGMLRRKLPDIRRQTLAMPSAFTAEMLSELESAGAANVSSSEFDKMSAKLMAEKERPKSHDAASPSPSTPVDNKVNTQSSTQTSTSDAQQAGAQHNNVQTSSTATSAEPASMVPASTPTTVATHPEHKETTSVEPKHEHTPTTHDATSSAPSTPTVASSDAAPIAADTKPGSIKITAPGSSKLPAASTHANEQTLTPSTVSTSPNAPASMKLAAPPSAAAPAPNSTKIPVATTSASQTSSASPASMKLAAPPSSAAPAPTSMKLSAPPSSAAPAPSSAAPSSIKFSAATTTGSTSEPAATPQPAAILLDAAKPPSFTMALSPEGTKPLSMIETASSAPASDAPAPTASSSIPVAVPVSTKIDAKSGPRSSKYTFKSIPLETEVAGSPAFEDSFTDLMEPKSPKSSSPAPIEEAPKSGKLNVASSSAPEALPSDEFLVSTPSAIDASVWEDRIIIVNAKQLEEWDTQGSIVLRLETKELVDISVEPATHTVEISFGNTNPRSFSPHSICVYRMESSSDANKIEKAMKNILSSSSKKLKCMTCQSTFTMQKMLECAKCGKSTLVVFESGSSASDSASEARTSSGSSSSAQQRQSVYMGSVPTVAPHVEDAMDASSIPTNRKIYTRTVHLQGQNGEMEEMHYWFPCYLVPFNTSVQKEQRASIVVSDNKMLIFIKRRARKGSVVAYGKTGREGVPGPSEEEYKDEELLISIPLRSVRRIVAGPFWQWFRVESSTNADAYMFLTRSHARTFRFLQSFKARFGWVEVSNKNKECLANVQASVQAVLRDSRASAAPLVSELDDFAVDLYFMAYQRIKSGFSLLNAVRASTMVPAQKDTTLVPRSIVLTKHNVLILEEDYAKWPSLAVANWVTPKTPHFSVLHHYSYHDVVSLATVHPFDHPNFVAVTFEYNTSSGATSQQQIVLITQGEAERAKFISLLSQRYQEHFHIKLVPDQN